MRAVTNDAPVASSITSARKNSIASAVDETETDGERLRSHRQQSSAASTVLTDLNGTGQSPLVFETQCASGQHHS